MTPGFDPEQFVADCLAAAPDRGAVADVVARAISDPISIEEALTRKLSVADLGILHYSEHLTVQHVVFPPAHRTGIHDHRIWAVIGTWAEYEENHLYRRSQHRLIEDTIAHCAAGETITLEADAIHEVRAPPSSASAALHVYGGPLFDQPRHSWSGEPLTERSIDDAAYLDRYLADLRHADVLVEPPE